MYASEEESIWSKLAEISTWVLLFIALVPGSALAYFAETSLPNSPLYPIKRGIETVVLTLASVNTSASSLYQISLARTRVDETKQLFATSKPVIAQDFQQLDATTAQIDAAQIAINNIHDKAQQAQMKQQLQVTVIEYKQQLAVFQQQLTAAQNSTTTQPTPPATTNTTDISTEPVPTTQETISNVPTPNPDFSTLTPQQIADLQQKIEHARNTLDEAQQSLDANANQQGQNEHHKDNNDNTHANDH